MKVVLRIAGVLITIASLIFVSFSIYRSFGKLTEDIISIRFVSVICALSLVYAAALQLVGIAWHAMVIAIDLDAISRSKALAIFNRSQVYKYLPGNVFHMVGRYSLAKTAGASHPALAFAQIGEIVLVAMAALTVAVIFSTTILLSYLSASSVVFIAAVATAAVVAAAIVAKRFGLIDLGKATALTIVRVFSIYLVFFVVNGLMAVALLISLAEHGGLMFPIIGIASGAWLLGFAIPGAPGGLGAREAVMIGGMAAIGIPASTATAVAIGHRIATVTGDALVALIEFIFRPRDAV